MFARLAPVTILLLAAGTAIAQEPAHRFERGVVVGRPLVARTAPSFSSTQMRQVSLELRENGAVVTRSSVRLRLGMVAAVPVDGPYAVRLRVDASGDGYMVRPTLTRVSGTEWQPVPTPPMAVAQGERTRITVDPPASPAVEIAVRVD